MHRSMIAARAALALSLIASALSSAAMTSLFSVSGAVVTPLPQAHAHNDYRHQRPLFDALDHGFCSVEADIFLVNGLLLVGHDVDELQSERTLQSLYLEPLRRRISKNKGSVHSSASDFHLMIDIKSESKSTFKALSRLLADYRDVITPANAGPGRRNGVRIVVSGNRDHDLIAADKERLAGIDGRLSDLDSTLPTTVMPWISDNWTKHFKWNGSGAMPPDERRKLREIVGRAHRSGRRIRFWKTPETKAAWRELAEADVDFINTDKLAELAAFLLRLRQK